MMPLVNGMETTREIRARIDTGALTFTTTKDEQLIEELLRAGTRGCV